MNAIQHAVLTMPNPSLRSTAVITMADIAERAGVSVATVSRALAGSRVVAAETRARVQQLATEVGFVANAQAQNFRLGRTKRLSVVIPLGHETQQSLTDPLLGEMLGHLADEISARGYRMELCKIVPPMRNWLRTLIAANLTDGIVIIGQSTEHAAIQRAAREDYPLVVWGGALPQQRYCTVGTDNLAGARSAVEHLIKLGRRNIVFAGNPSVPEIEMRYLGYRQALAMAAQPLNDHLLPVHLMADSAYQTLHRFLTEHSDVDAIFAASDVIALSAMRAAQAAGLSVPHHLAVVGYDDIHAAAYAHPALTTVRQDLRAGAQALVELMFKRLRGEPTHSIALPTQLIVRASCGQVVQRSHS